MKKVTISLHTIDDSSHLDFFFATDNPDVLLTYEFRENYQKFLSAGEKIAISRKNNHRGVYLTYEGQIENNRGFLKILWTGKYNDKIFSFNSKISVKIELNNLVCL